MLTEIPCESNLISKSNLSYLDSHVTRFLLYCVISIQCKSPNDQRGATVEIRSRDYQEMSSSTVFTRFKSQTSVSFSLGGQMAGFIGKAAKRAGVTIGRITGLDPAGEPMKINSDATAFPDVPVLNKDFSIVGSSDQTAANRLDSTDAKFVDTVSGDFLLESSEVLRTFSYASPISGWSLDVISTWLSHLLYDVTRWTTWLGSKLGQPVLFAFFELKILCWIELFTLRNRSLLAWSFELRCTKSGDPIRGKRFDKPSDSRSCGFFTQRISELRVVIPTSLHILRTPESSLPRFGTFSCRDVIDLLSVSEEKRSKLHTGDWSPLRAV